MTYTTEGFNLLDVGTENRWLVALMEAVKLGNVVHLDIILDAISDTE